MVLSGGHLVTSWDDGSAEDMRLADLLDGLGVRGTFYLSRSTCALTPRQICDLARRHEVAGHTLNHTPWGTVPPHLWLSDVRGGQEWLEDVLGQAVEGFAYPSGRCCQRTADLVRPLVGHARTTLLGATRKGSDDMLVHTTVHARPFPLHHRITGLRARWDQRRPWSLSDWPDQVRAADRAHAEVVHLWGHSWELSATDSWQRLRACLAAIAPGRVTATVSEWLTSRR